MSILLKITTIALIPALLVQGRKVKKNMITLPEPVGEREGLRGQGKKLSLLIIGDSAAAGVGVDHQDDALLGAILKNLEASYSVTWKLQAKTGDRSTEIIQTIEQMEQQHFDVIVTSVGVNDVTKLMPAEAWIKKQRLLYQALENKFNPQLIIAAGVPPMNMFPALPHPLGWLFGQYAKQMNQKLEQLVDAKPHMQWIEYDIEQYQALNLEMAIDGFHPNKEVYAFWAKQVTDLIHNKIE
jgi:lysophospholipase L1-like esterase